MLPREFDVEEYIRVRSEESFEDGVKAGEAIAEARAEEESRALGFAEGIVEGRRIMAEKLAEEYNKRGMELPDVVKQYLKK